MLIVSLQHASMVLLLFTNFTTVSLSLKKKVLTWKFDIYEKTKDNFLQSSEFFLLRTDLTRLLHCESLLDHIEELMDSNGDKQFSLTEFQEFFIAEGMFSS